MVKFNVSEFAQRNYKEGDTVYLEFVIERSYDDDESIWLRNKDNNCSCFINKNTGIVLGHPVNFRDGEIIYYNNNVGKVIKGFKNEWFVLMESGGIITLIPEFVQTIKNNEL